MKVLKKAWLVVFVGLALVRLAPASAAEPDPDLLAEQTRLDAGGDLNSRARRALFRARDRQDEGAYEEAVAIMSSWLDGAAGREHHLLRFNLAVSYFALDRPADALANLEKAVADQPRYARAWLRLGEAAYELEQFAQAGDAFTRAYELGPDHEPEVLYYAGVSQLSGGQAQRSFGSLARLLEAHPENARLEWYQALLVAAGEADQANQAAPYLEQLLAARPEDPSGWELAYRYHAGQADYEKAAAHLTVAGYLRPLNRSELVQLGDLYAVIGVPLQAARIYEQVFTADSEPKADEYGKMANAWLAAHEPEAALEAFRRSTEQDPDFGRGHLMMGYCALELGRKAEAREYLERAAGFAEQASAAQSLIQSLAYQ